MNFLQKLFTSKERLLELQCIEEKEKMLEKVRLVRYVCSKLPLKILIAERLIELSNIKKLTVDEGISLARYHNMPTNQLKWYGTNLKPLLDCAIDELNLMNLIISTASAEYITDLSSDINDLVVSDRLEQLVDLVRIHHWAGSTADKDLHKLVSRITIGTQLSKIIIHLDGCELVINREDELVILNSYKFDGSINSNIVSVKQLKEMFKGFCNS